MLIELKDAVRKYGDGETAVYANVILKKGVVKQ